MAKKEDKKATPQDVPERVQPPYDPNAKIGTGILIDGKPMRASPPATPASSPKGYKSGGSVTRGDGCAQRGHTKGRNV
jgi:hypothetical protein